MTAAMFLAVPETEADAARRLIREVLHSGSPAVQQFVHRVLPEPGQISAALKLCDRFEAALLSSRVPAEEATGSGSE